LGGGVGGVGGGGGKNVAHEGTKTKGGCTSKNKEGKRCVRKNTEYRLNSRVDKERKAYFEAKKKKAKVGEKRPVTNRRRPLRSFLYQRSN